MDYVLLIEKKGELAENLIELLEMAGIRAECVRSIKDVGPHLNNEGLFAVAANSLSLDGHIRTFARTLHASKKRKVALIVFGEEDHSGNEDVVDYYLQMPFDDDALLNLILNMRNARRSNVA